MPDATEGGTARGLVEAGEPLWASYDLALLDLDGVVYIGGAAVPGAPEHLERAVAAGMSQIGRASCRERV